MSDDETRRTPADDRVIALLERTLASRAATASASPGLAARVRARRRNHVVRRVAIVGGVALASAAAIVTPMVLAGNDDLPGVTDDPSPMIAGSSKHLPPPEPAPDGWRWESYGTVQALVPADWGLGTSGAGCWSPDGPQVGRPPVGIVSLCLRPSALDLRIPFVWFVDGPVQDPDETDEWVVESTTLSGQTVAVFSDDPALRSAVLASVESIEGGTDANGCAPTHPIATEFAWRPTSSAPLGTLRDITAMALCRYALPGPEGENLNGAELVQSGRVGSASAAAIIATAAQGAPVDMDGCEPATPYGYSATVLRIEHADGVSEAVLHGEGCARVGVDDGSTIHALTPGLATALVDSTSPYGQQLAAEVEQSVQGATGIKPTPLG